MGQGDSSSMTVEDQNGNVLHKEVSFTSKKGNDVTISVDMPGYENDAGEVIINSCNGDIDENTACQGAVTEQVPSYNLQLSWPQVEEVFKLEQFQQSGAYLGANDVNLMEAANKQEMAIQQRMFQNSRQEGINYLVAPGYQQIRMVTENSNVARQPNYNTDNVVEAPYKANNIQNITPYTNTLPSFGNLTDEQQNFIKDYIQKATSLSAIRELNRSPVYKRLPFITKYKLDCYVKKQIYHH